MVEQLAGYFIRLSRFRCVVLSLTLVVGIAIADYASGYALRLSLLYLIPIGLTAWVINLSMGVGTATIASVLWFFSFQKAHFYQEQIYYFWEAAIMLCSFMVVAWLSAHLRRALNQADERFFRVVEEVQSAIYIVDDAHNVVVYGNPVMKSLAGDLKEIEASSFDTRFEITEGISAFRGTPPNHSMVRDRITGRWYWRQSASIPWGRDARMKLVVLTDITEQKNAEKMRERHLEGMHHAAQLTTLAETASTLAHEINQPLMVIATYTDACQRMIESRNVDQEEISAILNKCHDQAVRASSIIVRLRDFIRQRQSKPTPCDSNNLLISALDITRPLLEERQVQVKVINPAPETIIEVDKTLLAQALANLIRNAVEAMDNIPVEQRQLSIKVVDQNPEQVLICVEDRGCGLGQSAIDSIFTPFVTTKIDGLGLGLSICKSIAEAHGGKLWAENNQQGGATFCLALPKVAP